MKKYKSIYAQPKRYAKKCNVPLKYAREICKWHLKFERTVKKHNKCPYCNKNALEREYSDNYWDDTTWIYCSNCDKEINEKHYPKLKVPGVPEENFDIFLWMAHFKESGIIGDISWIDFIKEHK